MTETGWLSEVLKVDVRRSGARGRTTIAAWVVFIVVCLVYIGSGRGNEADVGRYMDDLVTAFQAADGDYSDFPLDEERANTLFGENHNVVFTDPEGGILFALNDLYLPKSDVFDVLISPYRYDYPLPDSDQTEPAGVAVAIHGADEVLAAYRVVQTDILRGEGDPRYPALFPDIGQAIYERGNWYYDDLGGLTGDLWYYLEEEYKLSHAQRLVVVDYVNWEREMLADAVARMIYTPTPSGEFEVYLLYGDTAP